MRLNKDLKDVVTILKNAKENMAGYSHLANIDKSFNTGGHRTIGDVKDDIARSLNILETLEGLYAPGATGNDLTSNVEYEYKTISTKYLDKFDEQITNYTIADWGIVGEMIIIPFDPAEHNFTALYSQRLRRIKK